VIDINTLIAGERRIQLWGLDDMESLSPRIRHNAIMALVNLIGSEPVECEIFDREAQTIIAQCANINNIDLGLFLIQQGYASVKRAEVLGSYLETPYLEAEQQAQQRGLGLWSAGTGGTGDSQSEGKVLFTTAFLFFVCLIIAFTVLTLVIMKGFQKVIDAQNQNIDMMSRERQIREKERMIIAMLLDSELKANKSKIEAYLVVYEEMLRSMKDPDREPRYKSTGDIVQKQPILDRVIFDRNTDKLDILGRDLASALVHFYARIKTNPEYINLEPETPEPEAITIIEEVISGARKLNDMADSLMRKFENRGITIDQDELDRSLGTGE